MRGQRVRLVQGADESGGLRVVLGGAVGAAFRLRRGRLDDPTQGRFVDGVALGDLTTQIGADDEVERI